MRPIVLGCIVACLAAAPAFAADAPPISLTMDGPWVANYDADSCQLLAQFGSGESAIIARFTRYEPADKFDLALYGAPFREKEVGSTVRMAFGPGQALREVWPLRGKSGERPLLLINSQRLDGWQQSRSNWQDVDPPVAPRTEAAINHFTIRLNAKRTYRLELGSMGRPMAEMRKCMDTLLTHWGYDPKIVASLSRPVRPLGNPGDWIRSGDYPNKALLAGHSGIVQFRLDLDETGKVRGCHILARTNPDEFADLSCELLNRRARFSPALDAAGKPVKSFWVNKVRFMTPSD